MVAGAPDFKLRPTFQSTRLALTTELGASAPVPITDYQDLVGTIPSALTAAGDIYDADVPNVVDVALTCKVVTAGTGDLRAQYSSDGGTNWNYLGTGSGPSVSLSSTGLVDSGWVTIASAAQSAGAVLVRLASINGTDVQSIEVADAVVRARDGHTVTSIGSTGLMNQVEVNLGTVPRRGGHFDITTTGLTTGQNVIVEQINGPYTGKGTQADEAEMDQLTVSGQAISSTVIRCYWGSPTHVRGNFKFAYTLVSTLNTMPNATESAAGIAEILTQAEADAGTDDSRILTSLKARNRPQLPDVFSDFVVSGFDPALPGVSLNLTTPAGTAYILGARVSIGADTARAYTASRDTYLDVNASGTYTAVAVTNGATEPSVTANSLRILKVVTSASQITTITKRSRYAQSVSPAIYGSAWWTVSGVGVADGAWRKPAFSSLQWDNGSNFSTANNRYTAPASGMYGCYLFATAGSATTTVNYQAVAVYKNSVQQAFSPLFPPPGTGFQFYGAGNFHVYADAGDFLEFYEAHYNGTVGTLNFQSGTMHVFYMGGMKNVPGP